MHADLFDRYRQGGSILHRLEARVKLIALIVFILSNALLPDGAWFGFLLAWVCLLAMCQLSGLGAFFTLRGSLIALPFALAAASAIFAPTGHALAHWRLLGLELVPTDIGLLRFGSILARSWLSVQMGILMVTVTPFPDLIHAMEHLHFPKMLSTIIAFLYRYLFVLADEAFRLLRAREARSGSMAGYKAGGTLLWRATAAGHMAGQLFLRSYDRSDRIYNAMLSRGYSGNLRTMRPHIFRASDWAALGIVAVAIVLIQAIGRIA